MKIGIVVSEFNYDITAMMLERAKAHAEFLDAEVDAVVHTPGVFEIPLGWDGKGTERGRNYLFHERSTFKKMCLVWDTIVERSAQSGQPQFVNFLCHTYSMANLKFRTQLERILNYMQSHDGVPVTASQAKATYDELLS